MKNNSMPYAVLKSLRVRFGYTQEKFGGFIGCSCANYSDKETGKTPWSLRESYILLDKINTHLRSEGKDEMTILDLFPRENFFTQNVSKMKHSSRKAQSKRIISTA